MNKIKVLCLPIDNCGVGYFRSIKPHMKLDELYGDDFDVTIDSNPPQDDLSFYDNFDIIHFNKTLVADVRLHIKLLSYLKSKNKTIIMDLDDYWDNSSNKVSNKNSYQKQINDFIIETIKKVDWVTTTTEILAKEIRKYNKNVKILPNAIDLDDEQVIKTKNKYVKNTKLRIGLVLGSSHISDVSLLRGVINKLSPDSKKNIQFYLCGFDNNGIVKTIDEKSGQIIERPMKPDETVWVEYEKILTDNYKIVSDEYRTFLREYQPNTPYWNEENEFYVRRWTKNINNYMTHYSEIDVLLVPLVENKFNSMKSQLKIIEAGVFNKAVIAQNFDPYKIDLISALEKGGVINENGNSLLVETRNNHKDWVKHIEKLVKNPTLTQQIRDNLTNLVETKYNLKTITDERALFYKKIKK